MHTELDLETYGTRAGCAIASIGAVEFDQDLGMTGREFYTVVNLQSCLQAGLSVDPKTSAWWAKQGETAKLEMSISYSNQGVDLRDALEHFSRWFDPRTILWSNGAAFDQPILDRAYIAVGMVPPWDFRKSGCDRTILRLHPNPNTVRFSPVIKHHALHDAKAQAETLMAIADDLGIRL